MMTPEERKKMYEEYMKKLKDSKKKGNDAGNYETSAPHMQNFIDCVRSRENPIAVRIRFAVYRILPVS